MDAELPRVAEGLDLLDLSGDVLSNPHEGQALAFGMFVVLAAMMLFYIPLQRRASRWAK